MKMLPSIFSGPSRLLPSGIAAVVLALSLTAVGGELVLSGGGSSANPPVGSFPIITDPIVIGPIIGPIMPIDPLPPATGNFVSLNEELAFSAPVVTPTVVSNGGGTTTITTGGPSATGSINALNVGGTTNGSIGIYTHNLPADTYTITTTTISTGASITLGTLTITKYPPPISGPIPMGAVGSNGGVVASNAIVVGPIGPIYFPFPEWGSIIFGEFGTPLPTGFDLFDVASVTITNSSSVVVLTSTASPIENGSLSATSAVTPGADATSAKGYGQLHVTATNGKVKGILSLHASGVPASATYTYAINGTDVGSVTTSAKGRLSVYKTTGQKKSPLTDPFGITSISVHDSSGNVVVSASF